MKTANRKPIGVAAKAIGRGRNYVHDLIRRGKLAAYKVGGSDKAPWLEVDISELREASDKDSRWIPPQAKQQEPTKRRAKKKVKLHPIVAAWGT
ncbi:MAG: hypothetical protein FWD61_09445 [Phycisphaerales bacterium]|nr:hypothetical protein [Phycisphaerales bacterium]